VLFFKAQKFLFEDPLKNTLSGRFPFGTITKTFRLLSQDVRELDYFQTDGIQTRIYFISKDFPNHLAISSLVERGRKERRGLILSPLAELVRLSHATQFGDKAT